eukprot:757917-Hanusia_phi.AAC.1
MELELYKARLEDADAAFERGGGGGDRAEMNRTGRGEEGRREEEQGEGKEGGGKEGRGARVRRV